MFIHPIGCVLQELLPLRLPKYWLQPLAAILLVTGCAPSDDPVATNAFGVFESNSNPKVDKVLLVEQNQVSLTYIDTPSPLGRTCSSGTLERLSLRMHVTLKCGSDLIPIDLQYRAAQGVWIGKEDGESPEVYSAKNGESRATVLDSKGSRLRGVYDYQQLILAGFAKATIFNYPKGDPYEYNSKGRSFRVECMGYDTADCWLIDESDNNIAWRPPYHSIPIKAGRVGDALERRRQLTKLFVGQHDFDFDGIDELVVGIYYASAGEDSLESGGVFVSIKKLSTSGWISIGRAGQMYTDYFEGYLHADNILGDVRVEIKGNRISVARNLRGFYYAWALESGRLVWVGYN